jgi:hypothetical protein
MQHAPLDTVHDDHPAHTSTANPLSHLEIPSRAASARLPWPVDFAALPSSIWMSQSVHRANSGILALNSWRLRAKREIKEATRVQVPASGVAFKLKAATAQLGAVALLESMRRLLQEQPSAVLDGFAGRYPEDMADYIHHGSTYAMYVLAIMLWRRRATNEMAVPMALEMVLAVRYSLLPLIIS